MKAVTQVSSAMEAKAMKSLEMNYERAAAEAINKVKQDLATKEIEQRLKQEIERHNLNQTLSGLVPKPEAEVGATKNGNCNTLKMVTDGKAIWHKEDWSRDNVNNHSGRSRSNEESKRIQ